MGWSPQIHAGFHGSGVTWDNTQVVHTFRIRGYYPLWPDFPDQFSYIALVTCDRSEALSRGPTTPHQQRLQALTLARFRLNPFRSPLLRVSRLLSFPRGTEMFQFPRFPPTALCVQAAVHTP